MMFFWLGVWVWLLLDWVWVSVTFLGLGVARCGWVQHFLGWVWMCVWVWPFLGWVWFITTQKKHLFADLLQSSCSWKLCIIHRKTSALESLFNKVTGIKRVFYYEVFFLITPQNQITLQRKQISKLTWQGQSHLCSLVFCGTFFGVELSLFLKFQSSYFRPALFH